MEVEQALELLRDDGVREMLDLADSRGAIRDAVRTVCAELQAERLARDYSEAVLGTMVQEAQELHAAAARLSVERAEYRREAERLHADAAVGAAIQRACGELPEGFTIAIDLEAGAGSVELLWEDERWEPDFDLSFAGQINECIDEAIRSFADDRNYRDDDVSIDDLIGGNS